MSKKREEKAGLAPEAKTRNFLENPIKDGEDYYSILGVERTASIAQIKSAHGKLALKYHPDKNAKMSVEDRESAGNIFLAIQNAYKTLSDEQNRASYDQQLRSSFFGKSINPLDAEVQNQFEAFCRKVLKIVNPLKEEIPIEYVAHLYQGDSVEIGRCYRGVTATNLNDWERDHFIGVVDLVAKRLFRIFEEQNKSALGRGGGKIFASPVETTYGIGLSRDKSYTRLKYGFNSVKSLVSLLIGQEDLVSDLLQQYQEALDFTIAFNRKSKAKKSLLEASVNIDPDGQIKVLFKPSTRDKPSIYVANPQYKRDLKKWKKKIDTEFRALKKELKVTEVYFDFQSKGYKDKSQFQKKDGLKNPVLMCGVDECFALHSKESVDLDVKKYGEERQIKHKILALNGFISAGDEDGVRRSLEDLRKQGVKISNLDNIVVELDEEFPLLHSIEVGSHLNIVKLLVESGLDPEHLDKFTSTTHKALYSACKYCKLDVVEYLYRHSKHPPDLNKIKGFDGEGPLHAVIRKIEPIFVLPAGFIIGGSATDHIIGQKGQLEKIAIIEFLLKNGASLEALDRRGRKPIDCCQDDLIRVKVNQAIKIAGLYKGPDLRKGEASRARLQAQQEEVRRSEEEQARLAQQQEAAELAEREAELIRQQQEAKRAQEQALLEQQEIHQKMKTTKTAQSREGEVDRLRQEAFELMQLKKYSEAIEKYQQLIQAAGDDKQGSLVSKSMQLLYYIRSENIFSDTVKQLFKEIKANQNSIQDEEFKQIANFAIEQYEIATRPFRSISNYNMESVPDILASGTFGDANSEIRNRTIRIYRELWEVESLKPLMTVMSYAVRGFGEDGKEIDKLKIISSAGSVENSELNGAIGGFYNSKYNVIYFNVGGGSRGVTGKLDYQEYTDQMLKGFLVHEMHHAWEFLKHGNGCNPYARESDTVGEFDSLLQEVNGASNVACDLRSIRTDLLPFGIFNIFQYEKEAHLLEAVVRAPHAIAALTGMKDSANPTKVLSEADVAGMIENAFPKSFAFFQKELQEMREWNEAIQEAKFPDARPAARLREQQAEVRRREEERARLAQNAADAQEAELIRLQQEETREQEQAQLEQEAAQREAAELAAVAARLREQQEEELRKQQELVQQQQEAAELAAARLKARQDAEDLRRQEHEAQEALRVKKEQEDFVALVGATKMSLDLSRFTSKQAPKAFLNLKKEQREKILEGTSISITEEELLHARRFLALVALTGGQHFTGEDQPKSQKDLYEERGILNAGLPDPGGAANIEEQISGLMRFITDDNIQNFYARLVEKRPLTFYMDHDAHLLRDGKTRGTGCPGDKDPREYIFYSEIEFAAMLQVSGPTQFINNGNRYNQGESTGNDHQTQGIIGALVGARFEIDDAQEALHCIKGNMSRVEDSYKKDLQEKGGQVADFGRIKSVNEEFVQGYKAIWSKFYEGHRDTTSSSALDKSALEHRLYISYKKLFAEAVANSQEDSKAYIRVVGLGDGAWAVGHGTDIQESIGRAVKRVFDELSEQQASLIAAIEFSQYNHEKYVEAFDPSGELRVGNEGNRGIDIISSKNAPFAHKLPEKYSKCQLCLDFAWDGGSYVGNEYWVGALSASGDPAAACCSSITVSMNPELNPKFLKRLRIVEKDGQVQDLSEFSKSKRSEGKETELKHKKVDVKKGDGPFNQAPTRAKSSQRSDHRESNHENLDYIKSLYGAENLVLMWDTDNNQYNYVVKFADKAEAEARSQELFSIGIRSRNGSKKVAVPLDKDNNIVYNDNNRYSYDNNGMCGIIFNDLNIMRLRQYYNDLQRNQSELVHAASEARKFLKEKGCEYEFHVVGDENNYFIFAGKDKKQAEQFSKYLAENGVKGARGNKVAVPMDREGNIIYDGEEYDYESALIDHFTLILNDRDVETLKAVEDIKMTTDEMEVVDVLDVEEEPDQEAKTALAARLQEQQQALNDLRRKQEEAQQEAELRRQQVEEQERLRLEELAAARALKEQQEQEAARAQEQDRLAQEAAQREEAARLREQQQALEEQQRRQQALEEERLRLEMLAAAQALKDQQDPPPSAKTRESTGVSLLEESRVFDALNRHDEEFLSDSNIAKNLPVIKEMFEAEKLKINENIEEGKFFKPKKYSGIGMKARYKHEIDNEGRPIWHFEVDAVFEGGPAEKAGFEAGNVVSFYGDSDKDSLKNIISNIRKGHISRVFPEETKTPTSIFELNKDKNKYELFSFAKTQERSRQC